MTTSRKIISTLIILLLVATTSVMLLACDTDDDNYVDYSTSNDFEYEVVENADMVSYVPLNVAPKYGLIFYVGTVIEPTYYEYLASALAKEGYVAVIPKMSLYMAYAGYKEVEPAFAEFADVEFFVGGHSQGGGAAVRRAMENASIIKGVVLYAPLCYNEDNIVDCNIPTLLLEATNDGVLTAEMKANALTRISADAEKYMLTGSHMSFSTFDDDGVLTMFNDGPLTQEEKDAQRQNTISYTLNFMRSVVTK